MQHEHNSNIARTAASRKAEQAGTQADGVRQTRDLELPVTLMVLRRVHLLWLLGPQATAKFGVSSGGDFFQLPAIELPAFLSGIVLSVILLVLAGYALVLKARGTAASALAAGRVHRAS